MKEERGKSEANRNSFPDSIFSTANGLQLCDNCDNAFERHYIMISGVNIIIMNINTFATFAVV